ncbi:MAG TPA: chromosomal replication initiator protein DnaA [Ruminiclostridium sp.]|jgi:chromosomal replication initiator protein|nr:chromosomal replication initiator protein DnaA [Clostridiaceae bacterium]HAA24862.1 chromosomal replication initiator protein DnaA [Ruminiclostridium sp.]
MYLSAQDIWNKVEELLDGELTKISLDTWIKTVKPLHIKNDTITIEAPSEFNRDILKNRYMALITNTVKAVTNKEYNIEITIKDTNNAAYGLTNEGRISPYSSLLNPKYTFDTFVRGSGNQFAHAGAVAVAEFPAKRYNPYFIYGGVGLGKTHLMHAIGHYIIEQNPKAKVLYVTSEKFTNELINSIRDDKNEEFRNKYRNIDVLLIDDIQFIIGKERTQEEFFHTFNSLYEAQKQIIISSDKAPKEIDTLEERLRSRFEWGLIADIQPPDLETRIAILKKKAQLEKFEVPDEVLTYIADNIVSNIRELEGALNRVVAYASLTNSPMTVELTQECLKQMITNSGPKEITPSIIMKTVSRYFDVNPEHLIGKKRSRDIAFPRQLAMYLCRELTDLSLPKIGQAFGGRDHTTVLHACDKIYEELQNNSEIKRAVLEMKKNILGK